MTDSLTDTDRLDGGMARRDDDLPSIGHIAEVAVPQILPNDTQNILSGVLAEPNPYVAAAGMFVGDTFADEVAMYVEHERQRERDEADE
jgi:hypothetical protein